MHAALGCISIPCAPSQTGLKVRTALRTRPCIGIDPHSTPVIRTLRTWVRTSHKSLARHLLNSPDRCHRHLLNHRVHHRCSFIAA